MREPTNNVCQGPPTNKSKGTEKPCKNISKFNKEDFKQGKRSLENMSSMQAFNYF